MIVSRLSNVLQASSSNRIDDEIILKQNTTYLRSFTSGAASNIVNFKASFYEHTDKN